MSRVAGDGSKSYLGDGGPSIDATFNGMHNCAITADDQLLIADSWNHCVRKIDLASDKITTVIGTGEAQKLSCLWQREATNGQRPQKSSQGKARLIRLIPIEKEL